MSVNKKYYYVRVKENFYDTEEMKLIESVKDGYLYSNLLMKMYLLGIRDDGRLTVKGIPYTSEMLATVTGHKKETVEKALALFCRLGLTETLDNGVIYMTDMQTMVGRSSTEGERKKIYRQRINREKNVDDMVDECPDICPPEIEIEKEIEIEIEQESERESEKDLKRKRKPSLEEVAEYCRERENQVDAEEFVDYYEANGWKVGKNPMKDWKAAVRTWEHKRNAEKPARHSADYSRDAEECL